PPDRGFRALPQRGRPGGGEPGAGTGSRSRPSRLNAQRQARSVARLAAVQALYQMETGGAGVEAVVREFCEHRFDADLEGEPLARADEAFFADLARGVVGAQREIDAAIRER